VRVCVIYKTGCALSESLGRRGRLSEVEGREAFSREGKIHKFANVFFSFSLSLALALLLLMLSIGNSSSDGYNKSRL
jgi:hypothetical protein